MLKFFIFSLMIGVNVFASEYTIPQPKIQFRKSTGFRVSIPDESGMQLFAFHANINKKIEHLEAGQISGDVVRKTYGKWVYENEKIKLRDGDIIYYWVFVIKSGRGYTLDDGFFKVNGINSVNKKSGQYKRYKRHGYFPDFERDEGRDSSGDSYEFRYFHNRGPPRHHGDRYPHFPREQFRPGPWTHNHNHQMHHDWPKQWHKHHHHKCNHHGFNVDNSEESTDEVYTTEEILPTTTIRQKPNPMRITDVDVESTTFPLIDVRFGDVKENKR